MKRIIAVLLSAVTLISSLAVGAYAFFEPMSGEQIEGALSSGADEDGKQGLVFSWNFEGVATEDKTYTNSVADEISRALKAGEATYTINSSASALAEFADLLEVGTFKQRITGRSFVLYLFSTEEAAQVAYGLIAEQDRGYARQSGKHVMVGDERMIDSIATTAVKDAVKSGTYYSDSSDTDAVLGDMFSSAGAGGSSFMQFKTPDSAIRLEDGEIVFGKACRDDGVDSFLLVDAYMDVAVSDFNYNKAHDLIGGKSFVLSATLRAPYNDYPLTSVSMELFRTRTYFTNESGERVVLDTVLAKYNMYTKEISIYSAGEEIKTGIHLSDYAETTVAVHVHPKSNSFDFYADGILIARDVDFLPDEQVKKLCPANGAAASGDTADYTPALIRLFYTSVKALADDALYISDFSWYFSDEYLDRSENDGTFAARSAELGDKVYFNLYLNFPRSVIGMGGAVLEFDIGGVRTDVYGEIVEGGELDGLIKYSVGIDFKDLTKDIKVTVSKQDHQGAYFYYSSGADDGGFLAKTEYKTSVLDYFRYLIDEKNGYSDSVRKLAVAVLNVGAYAQKRYGGYAVIPDGELANFGYAYDAAELDAVDRDTLCAAIDSEIYKETAKIGSVPNLSSLSATLVVDGGAYISVKYQYIGMRPLTVNGEEPTENESGKYEYRIQLKSPLNARGVYTVVFEDGESACVMKIPPLYLAASVIQSGGKSTVAQYIKSIYLYVLAAEEYRADTAEKTL